MDKEIKIYPYSEPRKKYAVYILISDREPVYIGCTSNIKQRLISHKSEKNFNSCFILKSYDTKRDALIAENSLVRFVSVFGDDNIIVNGIYQQLRFYREVLSN